MKVLYFNRKVLYWVIVGIVAVVLLILLLTSGGGANEPNYPTMRDVACSVLGK